MHSSVLRPYFLLLLIIGTLFLVALLLQPFMGPLTLAAIVAVVLQPLYTRTVSFVRGRRGLAALLVIFATLVCLGVPLFFLGMQITGEARDVSVSFVNGDGRTYIDNTIQTLGRLADGVVPGASAAATTMSNDIDSYLRSGLSFVISHLGGFVSSLAAAFINLFLFFIGLYYFLKDGPACLAMLSKLSPLTDSDDERIFQQLDIAINSIIKGTLAIAFIQGVLTAFGFMLFGIPNFVLWGLVAMLAACIPGIGTSLVLLPGIAFLLFTGHTTSALGLAVWSVLAVGLIDNFLGPRLMGRGTALHPLLVLLGVVGGLALFGPMGIFLGPLIICFLFAVLAIHTRIDAEA